MTTVQKILCVDHNNSNVLLLEATLEGLNVDVKTVVTAAHALKVLETESFETLIINLRPADIDGLEFISALRSSNTVSDSTQIIGTTTNALTAEHQKFIKAGVNEVMTRPISSERLKAVITGDNTTPETSSGSSLKMTYDFGAEDQGSALDAEVIRQLVADIGAENTKEALNLFRNDLETNHGWIQTSIGSSSEDIAMGAHSIKGSAKALGAAGIAQSAEDLETACRLGATDGDLIQLHAELGRAVTRFKKSLETTDLEKLVVAA